MSGKPKWKFPHPDVASWKNHINGLDHSNDEFINSNVNRGRKQQVYAGRCITFYDSQKYQQINWSF
jgi:hypothetical protein